MSEKIYYDERDFKICKKDRIVKSVVFGIMAILFMLAFFIGYYVIISTGKLILSAVPFLMLIFEGYFLYYFYLPFSGTKIGEKHFWIYGKKFDYNNVERIEIVYEIDEHPSLGPHIAYVVVNRPVLGTKRYLVRGEGDERPLLPKMIADIQNPIKFFKFLKKEKGIPVIDKRDPDQKEVWPDPV